MKQFKLLTAVALVIITVSCKKNADPAPPPAPTPGSSTVPKVKTKEYGNSAFNYEYDNSGRVTREISNTGFKTEYTYGNNTVTEDGYDANGVLINKRQVTLDASGLAIAITDNSNPALTQDLAYNNEGHLTKRIVKQNGIEISVYYYIYSNGNLVMDSIAEAGGDWSTAKYEYYPDIISTIERDNFGVGYYGKGNKNAVKKVIEQFDVNTMEISEFGIPEFDASGRIIKRTQTVNGGPVFVLTYLYY